MQAKKNGSASVKIKIKSDEAASERGSSNYAGETPNHRTDPVIDTVASYAIGKAVTSKTKDIPLAKNPDTERYAAAQKKLDETSGERLSPTKQTCATCIHWCGQRQIVNLPGGRSYIQLPSQVAFAKCSQKARTIYTMETMCRYWEPVR